MAKSVTSDPEPEVVGMATNFTSLPLKYSMALAQSIALPPPSATTKSGSNSFIAAVPSAIPAGVYGCRVTLTGESEGVDLPALRAALAGKCAALKLIDNTRLPLKLWNRRDEDNLTGLTMEALYRRVQADPDNETLRLAARFALAALEGGEDAAL